VQIALREGNLDVRHARLTVWGHETPDAASFMYLSGTSS